MIDDLRASELAALQNALTEPSAALREIHRVEVAGRTARVYELTATPADAGAQQR